ncbi:MULTISPECIES: hypothetical protein [unclassified Leifsonia]|uniref:hypothetical protein n=1 Tax=Leifsonia sp. CL147 TaxID=1798215 RepID=UPI0008A7613F|nr:MULTISPECIES: hypothetical protein [unclassified Leifsonia]SEH91677.1 hypothetical protein SAMN04515694_106152 [Leifsonia sp. CL154]SFL52107.1 hypothetical protein SAMN04515692_10638 [Leifsonia sp. CL147]
MKRTTGALAAAVAAVVVVAGAVIVAAVTQHPNDLRSAASGIPASSEGTSHGGSTPPSPVPSLSRADAAVLDYVHTLPTVDDVTADTVGEFTELTCATLRSPKMSTDFYAQLVAIETKGYSLTPEKANELLGVTARAACPDATRVVDSRGAQQAVAP